MEILLWLFIALVCLVVFFTYLYFSAKGKIKGLFLEKPSIWRDLEYIKIHTGLDNSRVVTCLYLMCDKGEVEKRSKEGVSASADNTAELTPESAPDYEYRLNRQLYIES